MVPKIFSSSEKRCLQARESWPFGVPIFHWCLPAWFPGIMGEKAWQECDPYNRVARTRIPGALADTDCRNPDFQRVGRCAIRCVEGRGQGVIRTTEAGLSLPPLCASVTLGRWPHTQSLGSFPHCDPQGKSCVYTDWGSLNEGCISTSVCCSSRAGLCYLAVWLPNIEQCLPSEWTFLKTRLFSPQTGLPCQDCMSPLTGVL